MKVEEQRLKTLIIQYDDSIRYRKKLLDCNFAEALLSIIPICMKNRETLDTKINEKLKECEQLKSCLERARCKIAKLYVKHEENTEIKEFLDFAIFLTTFRDYNEASSATPDFVEDNLLRHYDISVDDDLADESIEFQINETASTDECKCSKIPLYMVNEDILTLNSKLETVHESLNVEKLERKRIESERDSFENFSNELSYLLFQYYNYINKSVATKETNTQTIYYDDHSYAKETFDSNSSSRMNNSPQDDQIDIESCIEVEYELSSSPASYFQDDSIPLKKIDAVSTTPNTNGLELVASDENSTLHKAQNFEPIQESHVLSYVTIPSTPITSDQQSYLPKDDSNIQADHNLHPPQNDAPKVTESTLVPHTVSPKAPKKNEKLPSQISQFYCDICDRQYSTKGNLASHIRGIHNGVKPYQCPVCRKRFAYMKNLKVHTFTHGSEKPSYSKGLKNPSIEKKRLCCDICGRKYSRNSSLGAHLRIVHNGETPFEFIKCDRRFARKNNLKNRIKRKESQKQTKSTICDKSLAWKDTLQGHKLKHTSQRSFKCSACDRYFKYRNCKVRHEKKVHGKCVLFRCYRCEKEYRHKIFLIRHLRTNHLE